MTCRDPREKCDLTRYQFEYPCKYIDYVDLREAGTCVKVIEHAVPWREARQKCVYDFNGTLVKIANKVVDDSIYNLIHVNRNRDYWIGLTSSELKHKHQQGFAWLNEAHPATYTNWVSQRRPGFLPSQTLECASKNSYNGKWLKETCYPTNNPYICQKESARNPGPPSLDVNFAPGHKFAYIGYKLVAKCSAFTELGATVKFRIEDALNVTDIDGDDDYQGVNFTTEEDGRFVEVDDRCFPRTKATMTVELTTKIIGTNLSCCWSLQDNFTRCSDIITTDVRYPPRRPILVIPSSYLLSRGDFLAARCAACVGTGGQLVWTLVMLNDQRSWSSNFRITQHMPVVSGVPSNYSKSTSFVDGYNITSIIWTVREDALCGPYIVSTFERLVGGDLHGSVLTCISSNPDNITVTTADVTARSSVFSVYGYEISAWSDKTLLRILLLVLGILIIPLGLILCMGVPFVKKKQKKQKILGKSTRAVRPKVLKKKQSEPKRNLAALHSSKSKQEKADVNPKPSLPGSSAFDLKLSSSQSSIPKSFAFNMRKKFSSLSFKSYWSGETKSNASSGT
ncbi:hypothetical protein RRG08_023601 [Elysia crispata]|uniref:C-type lectin domain-containing protein n=1 Tax=Elysia crispata TaxID=231223 RepID=A0AAE1B8V6_9GAST|nr:hypothetical protein RRG08_023601 [Elysia crispata]